MNGPGKLAFLQATLPYDSALVRVRPHGASCSLQSTALARNFQTLDLDLQALALVSADVPTVQTSGAVDGSSIALWGTGNLVPIVQIHDALVLGFYPAVNSSPVNVYKSLGNVSEQSYDGTKYVTCGSNVLSTGVHVCGLGNWDGVNTVNLAPLSFTAVSGSGYGNTIYNYTRVENRHTRYFWVDSCSTKLANIEVTVKLDAPASIPADLCSLMVFRVLKDELISVTQEVLPTALAGGTSVVTVDIAESGFYALALSGGFLGATAVSQKLYYAVDIQLTQETSICTRQLLNTNLLGASNQVEKLQVNGSAMLIQNTQAVMGRGAKVYALSVGQESPYFPDYTANVNDKVISSNSQSRFDGAWEHGVYGFCKPERAYRSRDAFRLHPGAYYENLTDPLNADGMSVFAIQVVKSDTYSPRATLTVCAAYEFTTRSQMFVKGYSTITQDDLGKLVDTLQLQHPFTENPFHWSAFLDAIKGGAKKVLDWAPKIAAGVGTATNVASGIANILAGI